MSSIAQPLSRFLFLGPCSIALCSDVDCVSHRIAGAHTRACSSSSPTGLWLHFTAHACLKGYGLCMRTQVPILLERIRCACTICECNVGHIFVLKFLRARVSFLVVRLDGAKLKLFAGRFEEADAFFQAKRHTVPMHATAYAVIGFLRVCVPSLQLVSVCCVKDSSPL